MIPQGYPRETVEPVFFDELAINGVPPTDPVEFSLTQGLDRPLVWGEVQEFGGRYGFNLVGSGYEPGYYKVWIRSGGVVLLSGQIRIT